MEKNFVHLHVHSEYSLLDGACRIKGAVAKAKELGMPALALTDHGVMYGAITFYKECKKAGIRPIIGCEVYVAQRGMADKEAGRDNSSFHLVLLVKDKVGYANICQLVSAAYLDGFYYKPRVDMELLRKHSEGLIALSACLAGQVPQALLKDIDEDNIGVIPEENYEQAKAVAAEYLEIFGEGNYYLELQNHHIGVQMATNPLIARIGRELNIPLVATNDCHYLNQEDSSFHDILLCVQTGRLRDDVNRMRFPSDDFYLKSREEMEEVLGEYPDALNNTLEIAEKCNYDFTFGEYSLPDYPVPPGHDKDSYLKELCYQGFEKKYPNAGPELVERLEYELGIIKQMGFPGYFLIMWDVMNFCHESGILVGPGRGSAAGSIVAYSLGITNIDPIRFDLIFERFLNPERISMPDIDTDFCVRRRGEVADYLVQRYGADKVAQIVTFGTMKAKGSVRDVGRVLDIPLSEVNAVAKLIPDDLKMTIDKALQESPELKARYEREPRIRELLDFCRKIEGMPRHASTHAAGIVVAKNPIVSYMPVQKLGDGIMATQFEKDQVEEQGLLKMDLLGLRTLTLIGDAVDNIKRSRGITIDMDKIDYTDKKTYEMLCDADSAGVFQLESDGMKGILRGLHPERLEDLTALVALYRPGPLGSGMVDDFIERKHGRKKVTYLHPLLKPILEETYGVMLYQEQVMQVASSLAGFTLGQSDSLRRIMGKKKPEYLPPERAKFLAGARNNNIDEDTAGKIFDLMEYFSGYGFNKSHSAAYAVVTYQTAWLKANYPVEYMAALLTSVMEDAAKVTKYMDVCRKMGIQVLAPDVNESYADFSVSGSNIRFGLAAIKNVGKEAVQEIIDERLNNGDFTSMLDLCTRIPLNKKILESLIRCGALDCLQHKRAQMLAVLEEALDIAKKVLAEKNSNQFSLFDFGLEVDNSTGWHLDMPELTEYSELELLAMEKELIGFYISGHPLTELEPVLKRKGATDLAACLEQPDDSTVKVGVLVGAVKNLYTKKGDSMASFMLEDALTTMRGVVFPKNYPACRTYLREGDLVIMTGKISRRDEEPQLILEKIVPIQKLFIRLPTADDTQLLDSVTAMLAEFPGKMPVSLFFDDCSIYRELSLDMAVDGGDALLSKLRATWGERNIVIK